jgi:hypothetical protein
MVVQLGQVSIGAQTSELTNILNKRVNADRRPELLGKGAKEADVTCNFRCSSTNGVDSNRYMVSGATDHITGELDKLTVSDKYKANDQVHTANGAGMKIEHIGRSILQTPMRNLILKNVLHVPHATKNLVYASKLASDNAIFVELHGKHFLVKDQATRATMLEGRRYKGLYPLPPSSPASSPKAVYGVAPSFARWHSRLGHPSSPIASKVISTNNLPCHDKASKESVCDVCQMAKSHQLPYNRSTSVSQFPLELISSDVYGPAPISVGRHKYYVSFVDDYSKFTWVYLLKAKSDFFRSSMNSKLLFRECLAGKLSLCKPIGVENVRNSILSFGK